MRLYDIVALVTPDLSDEDALKVASEYRKILSDGGAEIVKDEPWGRRRLAYEIRKKSEGIYAVVNFTAESATAKELDRQLGLNESILRTKLLRPGA